MAHSRSRRWAGILALTSGTGISIFWFKTSLLQSSITVLTSWPPINRYTLLSLAFGFSGLCFNINRVYKAFREGDKRQDLAVTELRHRIVDRVRNVNSVLVTATSLRGLALGLEQKHRTATITDNIIAESIRAAALDLEAHYSGAPLTRRMLVLNQALQELDNDQPSLLSVASLDRLDAFRQSAPVAAILALLPMLLIFAKTPLPWWASLLITATALAILSFSSLRAELYWKYDDASRMPFLLRFLRPSTPRMPFDFVILICTSRERWAYTFWHLVWAPIWETFPIFLRFGRDPEKIELMHRFRFRRACQLYAQLRKMQREKDLLRVRDRDGLAEALPQGWEDGFKHLCRDLWVTTGESIFRDMEQYEDMSIPLSDADKALVKYLV